MKPNKSKIYTTEELFKLAQLKPDELSEDLDEFDREALEGFKLIKNQEKLNALNDKIDQLIINDDKKDAVVVNLTSAKNRKTYLYVLSIAASLTLLIGLFILFKKGNEKSGLAENKVVPGNQEILQSAIDKDNLIDSNKANMISGNVTINSLEKEENKISPEKKLNASNDRINTKYDSSLYFNSVGINNTNTQISEKPLLIEQPASTEATKADNSTKSEIEDQDDKKDESIVYTTTIASGYANNNSAPTLNQAESAKNGPELKKMEEQNRMFSKGKTKKEAEKSSKKPVSVVPSSAETSPKTNKNLLEDAVNGEDAEELAMVNKSAEFVGGEIAFKKYVQEKMPIPAYQGDKTSIKIQFVVDKNGKVSKPRILQRKGDCIACEQIALDFIIKMPKWLAARCKGESCESLVERELNF